jgi:hypothetical protein
MATFQYRKTHHKKWKYVLEKDYTIVVPFFAPKPCYFYCGVQLLGFMNGNLLTMKKGYASDGATMAPDIECMMAEFFVHDFGCQFCDVAGSPFTRMQVDDFFGYQLRYSEHFTARLLAPIYYKGVRFGAHFLQSEPNYLLEIRTEEL